MNALDYTPDTGSMPQRLLAWFAINRDEELSYRDIATKFDVASPHNVLPSLTTALAAQILQRSRDEDGRATIAVGPRFDAWLSRRNGAPATSIGAGPKAVPAPIPRAQQRRTPSKGPAPLLPDVSAIPIRTFVSRPKFGSASVQDGRTLIGQMTELIARIRPGTSVELDAIYRSTAGQAITNWKKAHPGHQISLVTEENGRVSINRYFDRQPKGTAA